MQFCRPQRQGAAAQLGVAAEVMKFVTVLSSVVLKKEKKKKPCDKWSLKKKESLI